MVKVVAIIGSGYRKHIIAERLQKSGASQACAAQIEYRHARHAEYEGGDLVRLPDVACAQFFQCHQHDLLHEIGCGRSIAQMPQAV